MKFVNFTSGTGISFYGRYPRPIPDESLHHVHRVDDLNPPGEMTNTITLKPLLRGPDSNACYPELLCRYSTNHFGKSGM